MKVLNLTLKKKWIDIGYGKPEWGANDQKVYVLKLGEILFKW